MKFVITVECQPKDALEAHEAETAVEDAVESMFANFSMTGIENEPFVELVRDPE